MNKLSSKSGLLETMRDLLDRTSPMMIDAQCVRILTDKVGDVYSYAVGVHHTRYYNIIYVYLIIL